MSLKEKFNRFVLAMERQCRRAHHINMDLELGAAATLIKTVQCALQHRDFPACSRAPMVDLVNKLISSLSEGEPDMEEFLRMGLPETMKVIKDKEQASHDPR